MNLLKIIGLDKAAGAAVDSATAQAQAAADAYWQQLAPFVYVAAFMAATAWLFFFVPRFRLPWDSRD